MPVAQAEILVSLLQLGRPHVPDRDQVETSGRLIGTRVAIAALSSDRVPQGGRHGHEWIDALRGEDPRKF